MARPETYIVAVVVHTPEDFERLNVESRGGSLTISGLDNDSHGGYHYLKGKTSRRELRRWIRKVAMG